MIFVTVGTDHHPFDRLVKEADLFRKKGITEEEIFIQVGTSNYKPKFCKYAEFLPFNKMIEKINEAKIVITHGGPGCIMSVIYRGKVPIVFPRRKKFGEHVDDHQVLFAKKLEEKRQIIVVNDVKDIENKIQNYDDIVQKLKYSEKKQITLDERVANFAQALDEICGKLIRDEKV